MLTPISLIFTALLGVLPYVSTIKLPPSPSFWAEWVAVVLAGCWLASLARPQRGGIGISDGEHSAAPAGSVHEPAHEPAPGLAKVPAAVFASGAFGVILVAQLLAHQPMFRGAPVLAILALGLASLVCLAGARLRAAGQTARLLDVWSKALLVALWLNLVAVLGERQGWHLYIYQLGWRAPHDRAEGLVGQPNQLAVFAALAGVAANYLWMRGKLSSMAQVLAGLAVAVVIAATGSRAGLLMGFAGLALSALALREHPRRGLGGRLLLVACALMISAQIALPLLDAAGSTASGAVAAAARGESRGRIELWRDSWALVKLHPLIGVGYGNFMAARWSELSTSLMEANANQAHNLVAQLAVELGLAGAVLVLVPLGYALWRCLKVATRRGIAPEQFLAASLALLIAGYSMVEYPLWYLFFLLPFALALGLVEQPEATLRANPVSPVLRFGGWALAGVVCAVLALDYERSEELYASLDLQQRAGEHALIRIPLKEASEISALSAFDLYANLMYSRILAPDGLFMDYKLEIAERATLSMTNQETIGRQVALLAAANDVEEANKLLARTKRNPVLERDTRGVLKALAPLHPRLTIFVAGLPPLPLLPPSPLLVPLMTAP